MDLEVAGHVRHRLVRPAGLRGCILSSRSGPSGMQCVNLVQITEFMQLTVCELEKHGNNARLSICDSQACEDESNDPGVSWDVLIASC